MNATLQCLAQVQNLGVEGQNLCKHDEDVADVGVISSLQAVNRSLEAEMQT